MRHGRLRAGFRQGSARSAGLAVAAFMALASASVVAYFMFDGGGARQTRAAEPPVPSETLPNLLDTPRSKGNRSGAAFQGTKGLSAQIASKTDPTRLAGRIISVSLEPLEAKRYHAEKPEAFIYLKDGRTLHVRSDTARLFMPNGEGGQPESGTLIGNVRIGIFAARPDGKEIVPGDDQPELLVSAPGELTFDLTVGEGRIPENLTVTSTQVEFAGRDLTVLYNQPNERLDLVTIAKSDFVKVHPRAVKGKVEPAPAPEPVPGKSAPVVSEAESAKAVAEHVAKEIFYHAVFKSDVVVAHGSRRATADTMELWVHLIDNALPAGAIAPLRSPAASKPAPVQVSPDAQSTPPAATDVAGEAPTAVAATDPNQAQPSAPAPADEDVVITWSGPLEMRPSETRPGEMGADDFAMEFSGKEPRRVTLADPDMGAIGLAQRLHYGATHRELVFEGPGADGVLLAVAKSGEVEGGNIRANLGTGLVTVSSPGVLRGASGLPVGPAADSEAPGTNTTAGPERFLAWKEKAEFQFEVENGAMTGHLQSATIAGAVVAADKAASLSGQLVKAWFDPAGKDSSVLKRLESHELVQGSDGRGGSLWCDDLGVDFKIRAEDPTRSDPIGMAAKGLVVFSRTGSTLEGGQVDAVLGLDENGRTQVRDVVARDAVRFERVDGVRAWADELRSDVRAQVVDLLGRHAAVAKGPTRVNGEQIRLDGAARSLEVFGPGRFAHEEPGDASGVGPRATARWTKGMAFDDRAGVLECRGEAVAVMFPDPLSRRTFEADAVKIELTEGTGSEVLASSVEPKAGTEPGATPAPPAARRILRAKATGADQEREGGQPARVEAVRFERDPASTSGRRLVEAAYLEGSTILADDVEGMLDVPSAGVLLVVDRRASDEPAPGAPAADVLRLAPTSSPNAKGAGAPESGTMTRGDALFRWADSLHVERDTGTMTMKGSVRLIQVSTDGSEQTELESQELTAQVQDTPGAGIISADDPEYGKARRQFTSATATGSVWMRSGGKEITADTLEYDALARTAKASALGDHVVTMFDPASPTPAQAKVLFWDMGRNRIEIRQPATIVVPR